MRRARISKSAQRQHPLIEKFENWSMRKNCPSAVVIFTRGVVQWSRDEMSDEQLEALFSLLVAVVSQSPI